MSDGVQNVSAALARFAERWQPHRSASVNYWDIEVVELEGEFIWHTHPERTNCSWCSAGNRASS